MSNYRPITAELVALALSKAPVPLYKEPQPPKGTPEEWARTNIGGEPSSKRYYARHREWDVFMPPIGSTPEDVRIKYRAAGHQLFAAYSAKGHMLGMTDVWAGRQKYDVRLDAPSGEAELTKEGIVYVGAKEVSDFINGKKEDKAPPGKGDASLGLVPFKKPQGGAGPYEIEITIDAHLKGGTLRITGLPPGASLKLDAPENSGPVRVKIPGELKDRVQLSGNAERVDLPAAPPPKKSAGISP